MRRAIRGVALACVLLGAQAGGQAGPSAAAVCGQGFALTPLPHGVKSINAIAALTPTNVWGVGTMSGTPDRTAALQWDGTAWTKIPTATIGQEDEGFNGVAAVGPRDQWAVGYAQSGGGYQAMIQHWNGTSWTIAPSPQLGTPNNSLTDVADVSATDAWAVGFSASTTDRVPLAEHWNGSSWATVPVPRAGAMSNGLLGVTAIATDDVWAVGYASDGSGFRPLIEHWDGSSWRQVLAPGSSRQDRVLTGIAAAPDGSLFAVGYRTVGSRVEGLTMRRDDSGWRQVPAATVDSPVSLFRDVAVSTTGTAWSAGFRYDGAVGDNRTLGERWNGKTWSQVVTPDKSDSSFASVGIVPGTGEVWMGGRFGVMARGCATAPAIGHTGRAPAARPRAAGRPETSHPAGSSSAAQPGPSEVSARIAVVARDVASSAGIAETTKTWGAAAADADGDGDIDIVLGRHQVRAHFYRNTGSSTFVEPQPEMFPAGDRHRCAWIEVNHDARPDVVCLLGADAGTDFNQNELWIQRPNGSFQDRADGFGLIDPTSRGRTPFPIDANDDGWTDVLVTSRHVRPDGLPAPDHLYLNQGGSSFVSTPAFGLDSDVGIQGSCTSAGDFSGDGLPDVLQCRPSGVRVFANVGGRSYTDATAVWKAHGKAKDAILADMNADGRLDEVVALAGSVEVRLQAGGTFKPAGFSYPSQWVIGLAAGDVNTDGAPDLYLLRGTVGGVRNSPDRVLINDGTGTSFTEKALPTTSAGSADAVVALDFDGNGMSDFLVLNGGDPAVPGPVQLIAFFPSP